MRKTTIFTLLVLLLSFALVGCASSPKEGSTSPDKVTSPPPEKEAQNRYFDFDDIPVPKDMEIKPDNSILFESPDMKAGVVIFKGRVDAVSLFDFFMNNMPKENWHMRSYFKYGRYIMVFEKPKKDCIIRIKDHSFNTELQVWVTPRFPAEKEKMQGPDMQLEKDLPQ